MKTCLCAVIFRTKRKHAESPATAERADSEEAPAVKAPKRPRGKKAATTEAPAGFQEAAQVEKTYWSESMRPPRLEGGFCVLAWNVAGLRGMLKKARPHTYGVHLC